MRFTTCQCLPQYQMKGSKLIHFYFKAVCKNLILHVLKFLVVFGFLFFSLFLNLFFFILIALSFNSLDREKFWILNLKNIFKYNNWIIDLKWTGKLTNCLIILTNVHSRLIVDLELTSSETVSEYYSDMDKWQTSIFITSPSSYIKGYLCNSIVPVGFGEVWSTG